VSPLRALSTFPKSIHIADLEKQRSSGQTCLSKGQAADAWNFSMLAPFEQKHSPRGPVVTLETKWFFLHLQLTGLVPVRLFCQSVLPIRTVITHVQALCRLDIVACFCCLYLPSKDCWECARLHGGTSARTVSILHKSVSSWCRDCVESHYDLCCFPCRIGRPSEHRYERRPHCRLFLAGLGPRQQHVPREYSVQIMILRQVVKAFSAVHVLLTKANSSQDRLPVYCYNLMIVGQLSAV
jgi:hypothetical protein